jgi:hypothetical protein
MEESSRAPLLLAVLLVHGNTKSIGFLVAGIRLSALGHFRQ